MKRLIFLFLSLIFSVQVFAASLYCDFTNGNDANNCTNGTTQLCKTLQRCVNVATGGDILNIANTSAQTVAASITWNTGYTADNTKYLTIQAWDNGGAITIQRPDESSARVAATIATSVANIFSTTSQPLNLTLKNLKFTNTAFVNSLITIQNEGGIISGCQFDSTNMSAGGASLLSMGGGGIARNNYFILNSTGNNAFAFGTMAFIDNYIQGLAVGTGMSFHNTNDATLIYNNILDFSAATTTGTYTMFSTNQRSGPGFFNNTFIGNTSYAFLGISFSGTTPRAKVFNNMFYKFNHASSIPIRNTSGYQVALVGYNAYFDSNASSALDNIGENLTAFDVTGSGDPFVDSASDDYTVTGSTAEGAGLTNPKSSIDIGAVQGDSGGGGGNSEHSFTWVN